MYYHYTEADVSVGGVIYHNIRVVVGYELVVQTSGFSKDDIVILKIEKRLTEKIIDVYNNTINLDVIKDEILHKELVGGVL